MLAVQWLALVDTSQNTCAELIVVRTTTRLGLCDQVEKQQKVDQRMQSATKKKKKGG